jgi:hypothetical protein
MNQPAQSEPSAQLPTRNDALAPSSPTAVPSSKAGMWKWWTAYGVLIAVFIFLGISFDDWSARGGMAVLGILTGLRLLRANTEAEEDFRGHCRYCGHELCAADRECPGCERTVPKSQRLGESRI